MAVDAIGSLQLRLRPAGESDVAFSETINRQNMAPYFEAMSIEWDSAQFRASWPTFDNHLILGNEEPVGVLRLAPAGDVLEVRDLQVLPARQRNGVGTWALTQAVELARGRGYRRLGLRVYVANPAQQLYRRFGFVETHRDEQKVHMVCALPDR